MLKIEYMYRRQRMGEDLDVLEFDELRGLEQNVDAALKEVRQRKVCTHKP
jgi:hypothetical protein